MAIKHMDDYRRFFLYLRRELLIHIDKQNLITPKIEVEDIGDIAIPFILNNMSSK